MAAKTKAAKGSMKAMRKTPGKRRVSAGASKWGARTAKRGAYARAMARDASVQERLRRGAESARVVYLRATRRGDAADALLNDKKTQRELRRALLAFREAATAARAAKQKKQRRSGLRILLPVAVIGAGAIAAKQGVGQKLAGAFSSDQNGSQPASSPSGAETASAPST